jgi:hypothetical protein
MREATLHLCLSPESIWDSGVREVTLSFLKEVQGHFTATGIAPELNRIPF